jgi:hypothetical protein
MREIRPGLQSQSRLVLPDTVVLTKSFGPDERPCIVERTFPWLGKCATTGSFISLAS